jgi:hypothetical protein
MTHNLSNTISFFNPDSQACTLIFIKRLRTLAAICPELLSRQADCMLPEPDLPDGLVKAVKKHLSANIITFASGMAHKD